MDKDYIVKVLNPKGKWVAKGVGMGKSDATSLLHKLMLSGAEVRLYKGNKILFTP